MSNPKFSIGDKVAVCELSPSAIVIPITTVERVVYFDAGTPATDSVGNKILFTAGYYYAVADYFGPDGDSLWYFEENRLRPILPGEYTEDTQDIHKPIEAEA